MTVQAATVQPGWTIHIGPHDNYRHCRPQEIVHIERPEEDITVKDVLHAGTVVGFYWGDIHTVCGVVWYDRDDTVELVAS